MSVKPDRLQLMMMCDKLEADDRESFHPDQVAIMRSLVFNLCQPKVKDVVEMAMRHREADPGSFDYLFALAGRSDNPFPGSILAAFPGIVGDSDPIGVKLAAKLLEMTPERRQMVASRVAAKVRELEGPPEYRPYGGASADLLVIDDSIIRHGDRWSADPSTATPLDDIRRMRDQIRSNSIRVGVDILIRADEAMLAWKRSQDPELKLEGQTTPGSIPPLLAMRLSRGRYYATRRLLESEILGEEFPSRLPAILDGLLRSLEAIEAGQNPATVL